MCPSATISGGAEVLGKVTATADGSFTDETRTKGTLTLNLPAACVNIGGMEVTCDGMGAVLQGAGFLKVECLDPYYDPNSIDYSGRERDPKGERPASGLGCVCKANVEYSGGVGAIIPDPPVRAAYKTSGNDFTLSGSGGDFVYKYCVQGTTLTMTPPSTFGQVGGSVIFEYVPSRTDAGSSSENP